MYTRIFPNEYLCVVMHTNNNIFIACRECNDVLLFPAMPVNLSSKKFLDISYLVLYGQCIYCIVME